MSKVEKAQGKIDKEVLDIMSDEDILKTLEDDKLTKRLILNCFCEFLSEIKGLRKDVGEFSQMVSICSADKLDAFFKEVSTNLNKEEKRQKTLNKIKQSHKKSVK